MFLNVSLSALTIALLRHPIETLRALPEAIRCDPGAFTELPGVIVERLRWEWNDYFKKPDASDDFLKNLRR